MESPANSPCPSPKATGGLSCMCGPRRKFVRLLGEGSEMTRNPDEEQARAHPRACLAPQMVDWHWPRRHILSQTTILAAYPWEHHVSRGVNEHIRPLWFVRAQGCGHCRFSEREAPRVAHITRRVASCWEPGLHSESLDSLRTF